MAFAARKQASALPSTFVESRKERRDALKALIDHVGWKLIATHAHILGDGQRREDILRLRHKTHTARHQFVSRQVGDVLTVQLDRTIAHVDQPKHGLNQGRLTGAVRADDPDQFTLGQAKLDTGQDIDTR